MHIKGSKLFGIGLVLAILALAIGSQGQIVFGQDQAQPPCTVTLSPGQSIQEAIDGAPDGAVICLEPGEWQENLVIEKSLTLRAAETKAEPDVVIKSAKEGWPVILIKSDQGIEVRIEGLELTGAFGGCYKQEFEWIYSDGIEVRGHAKAVIQNNTISGNKRAGISMEDSSQATITNNTISGNKVGGIRMWRSSQATITNNTISGNGAGIGVADSSQTTIENNTIQDNRVCGISSYSDKPVKGEGNKMSGNGVDLAGNLSARLRTPLVPETTQTELSFPGPYSTLQETIDALAPGGTIKVAAGKYQGGLTIWKPRTLSRVGKEQVTVKGPVSLIDEAQGVTIEGVTITDSPTSGLFLGGSSQATIENNTIRGNVDGIGMVDSSQATIRDNKVFANYDYGVALGQGPCFDSDEGFAGNIEGSGNEIHDNAQGDVCPTELKFLTTQEEGCYGPQCKGTGQ